jgi:hypothetical protein
MRQGRSGEFDNAGRNHCVDLQVNDGASGPASRPWDQDFISYLQQRFDELGTEAILDALDALDRVPTSRAAGPPSRLGGELR